MEEGCEGWIFEYCQTYIYIYKYLFISVNCQMLVVIISLFCCIMLTDQRKENHTINMKINPKCKKKKTLDQTKFGHGK
jgi:hypothetical protein